MGIQLCHHLYWKVYPFITKQLPPLRYVKIVCIPGSVFQILFHCSRQLFQITTPALTHSLTHTAEYLKGQICPFCFLGIYCLFSALNHAPVSFRSNLGPTKKYLGLWLQLPWLCKPITSLLYQVLCARAVFHLSI